MSACPSTLPAPPDVYALSALRPEMWSGEASAVALSFETSMRELHAYCAWALPWFGSEERDERCAKVRKTAAALCAIVYANSDATIDEEDIDHAATVASWILGRKVEVSGWMS